MRISTKKKIGFFCAGIVYGAINTGAICYGWYKAAQASSPQAIVDTAQDGETVVTWKNGKVAELIFRPVTIKPDGVKK